MIEPAILPFGKSPQDWLDTAKPGDHLCYYQGLLAEDREKSGLPDASQRKSLNELADQMWAASQRGHIELKQRRVGPKVFQYIATLNGR